LIPRSRERLGRLATSSGRSQAELIREGVDRVLSEAPSRTFRSMGKGRSGGNVDRRWDADELSQGSGLTPSMTLIVDAGTLFAQADADDPEHASTSAPSGQ
jgi:hypothetical protein